MSPTTYLWTQALHVFGFLLWTAGVLGTLNLLAAHARAQPSAQPAFQSLEKLTAIVADAGATLAIITGLIQAFGITPNWFVAGGGWLHAKVTLVVLLLLPIHVVARIKVRKFREGKMAAPSPVLVHGVNLIFLAIVVLAVVKPF